MSLPIPLFVTAAAARTAVGDSADQMAASIRAGIVRLREDPRYVTLPAAPDAEPAPARTVRVDEIDAEVDGRERLFALLLPLLAELLLQHAPRTALFLALPAPDAVTDAWGLDDFVTELASRLGLGFSSVVTSRAGRAAGLTLAAEAAALLQRGGADACLVAGVDSLVGPARLALLDHAERLKSPRNVDAFFPGEAAGAFMLSARGAGERDPRLLGVGAGSEPEPRAGERPSSGRGLTDAIRAALGEASPRWAISDFNGETYPAYEVGLVMARLGERLGAVERVTHPARHTGDVGAATSAVQVALAAAAFRRGWAPGEALLYAGSDGPERAAARLAGP